MRSGPKRKAGTRPACATRSKVVKLAGTALATAAFPLAVPFVMPATRTYSVLFTDTSGAPNTVELVFSGFKLWQRPKSQN